MEGGTSATPTPAAAAPEGTPAPIKPRIGGLAGGARLSSKWNIIREDIKRKEEAQRKAKEMFQSLVVGIREDRQKHPCDMRSGDGEITKLLPQTGNFGSTVHFVYDEDDSPAKHRKGWRRRPMPAQADAYASAKPTTASFKKKQEAENLRRIVSNATSKYLIDPRSSTFSARR